MKQPGEVLAPHAADEETEAQEPGPLERRNQVAFTAVSPALGARGATRPHLLKQRWEEEGLAGGLVGSAGQFNIPLGWRGTPTQSGLSGCHLPLSISLPTRVQAFDLGSGPRPLFRPGECHLQPISLSWGRLK